MMNADTENSTAIEISDDVGAENNTAVIEQDTPVVLGTSSEPSLTDSPSPLICSSSSSTSIMHSDYTDTAILLCQTFSCWVMLTRAKYDLERDNSDDLASFSIHHLLYRKTLEANYKAISAFYNICDTINTQPPSVILKDNILNFIDFIFYFIDNPHLQYKKLAALGFYKDLVIIKSLRAIKNNMLIYGPMVLENLITALSKQIDLDILDKRILSRVLQSSELSDDLIAYIIMRGMNNNFILDTTQKNSFALARLSGIAAVLRHKNNTYHTADLFIFHPRENRQPGITTLAEALTHANCHLIQLSLHWLSEAIDHPIVVPMMQAISDPRCQLQRLLLETPRLTDADITAMTPLLKQGKLTQLRLGIETLGTGQLTALTAAIHQLYCFQLMTSELTQVDIDAIAHMLVTNSPTKLYLSAEFPVDTSIAPIAQATMTKACDLKIFKYCVRGTLATSEMAHIVSALVAPSSQTQWGLYQYPTTDNEENWRLLLQAIADPNCRLTWLNLKLDLDEHGITELTNALEENHSLVMLNNLYSAPFADLNSPDTQLVNKAIKLMGKFTHSMLHKKSEIMTHNLLYKSLTLQQLAWLKATQTHQAFSSLPSQIYTPFTKWQTKAMKTLGLFSFSENTIPISQIASCSSMNNALRLDIEKPGPC